eukprot:365102-Chlamydomonas_euryale.AAC.5
MIGVFHPTPNRTDPPYLFAYILTFVHASAAAITSEGQQTPRRLSVAAGGRLVPTRGGTAAGRDDHLKPANYFSALLAWEAVAWIAEAARMNTCMPLIASLAPVTSYNDAPSTGRGFRKARAELLAYRKTDEGSCLSWSETNTRFKQSCPSLCK